MSPRGVQHLSDHFENFADGNSATCKETSHNKTSCSSVNVCKIYTMAFFGAVKINKYVMQITKVTMTSENAIGYWI